jgi:hypothetical protein
MPGKNDIDPLSITDGKISNLANINPKKLAKATEGQILVAQSDGRFAAKSLTGDISLEASGATSVTSTTTTTDGETTVVTGPAGPTGAQGPAGAQGAQGPTGSDATVTTSAVDSAGAVMETDLVQTSAGEGDASKPIKLDATGKIDASMIDDGDISYNNIADVPSSFTPSTHASTHATGGTDAIAPSDIGAEPAFTKNTAHNKNFGTAEGTVCEGDDSRLSDARTPVSHNHAASEITSGTLHDDRIAQSNVTQHQAAIDHDQLTNFSADEHRVIDDTSTTDTDKLWSAYNIVTQLAAKAPYNTATSTTDGLMDNTDKVFLDKLAAQISIPSSGSTAGFIGINDTSPSYRLDVDGTARFTSAVKIGGYTFPVFDGDVGKALVTDGDGTLSFSNIAVANVTGLGDSATKDVGTGSTNVAAGDHTHSTGNNGFVPAAGSNGQFLAHNGAFAAVAATNVTGLGDAATQDVGIGSGEVAAGNHTHSAATTSAAGFLSTTDKTKLDSYPSTNSTHNDEFLRKDGTFQSVPAAVSKKEITIEWGTDYSSNSVIDNITSAGSWTADAVTIRLYHNFGTEHIIVSVLDKDNAFGKGNNSQLDLNIDNNDDATVFINSSNSCDIKFNYVGNSISTNDTFKITIVG